MIFRQNRDVLRVPRVSRPRPDILRHHPGLATSPPSRYSLRVAGAAGPPCRCCSRARFRARRGGRARRPGAGRRGTAPGCGVCAACARPGTGQTVAETPAERPQPHTHGDRPDTMTAHQVRRRGAGRTRAGEGGDAQSRAADRAAARRPVRGPPGRPDGRSAGRPPGVGAPTGPHGRPGRRHGGGGAGERRTRPRLHRPFLARAPRHPDARNAPDLPGRGGIRRLPRLRPPLRGPGRRTRRPAHAARYRRRTGPAVRPVGPAALQVFRC
ncbi:hypothetical protein KCH_07210 [Kitasatospora cheerisanensis KCTC 2395]|uniref:Uncharacterized protein n=1 Tax=Kitasatospora cheerisanensis KCTC 2395 TaxID=1348663 RepID=A0A066ZBH2_9ACTN|nr:hypothetical protein KCH_07210 [Kitasatospora cheerisanensis KCTC 2395]